MTIKEGKKVLSDKSWEEAKGYIDSGDMESLEKQIRNETEIMTELAHDCTKSKKRNKIIAICGGAAALGFGYLCYKLGIQLTYKNLIDLYENGDGYPIVRDTKTNRIYSVKTECIGD